MPSIPRLQGPRYKPPSNLHAPPRMAAACAVFISAWHSERQRQASANRTALHHQPGTTYESQEAPAVWSGRARYLASQPLGSTEPTPADTKRAASDPPRTPSIDAAISTREMLKRACTLQSAIRGGRQPGQIIQNGLRLTWIRGARSAFYLPAFQFGLIRFTSFVISAEPATTPFSRNARLPWTACC